MEIVLMAVYVVSAILCAGMLTMTGCKRIADAMCQGMTESAKKRGHDSLEEMPKYQLRTAKAISWIAIMCLPVIPAANTAIVVKVVWKVWRKFTSSKVSE